MGVGSEPGLWATSGVSAETSHGLTGGLSVFKVDVLDDSARVQPGETFGATGDLPKHRAFASGSLGAFLGVAITPDVLSALRK